VPQMNQHGIFWLLFIQVGCPHNVNSWIKEERNIDRRCKITLFSYFTTVCLNISRIFYWNCRGKINKPRYTTQHPLETRMSDRAMLNLRREIQKCIHSNCHGRV